jgi:Leucine-rich repeat (LRR) protein
MPHNNEISLEESHALSKIGVPIGADQNWDASNRNSTYFASGGHVRKLQICGEPVTTDNQATTTIRLNDTFNELKWLSDLQIIRCNIRFPTLFSLNLPYLQSLNLFGCHLLRIPNWIASLPNITSLAINFDHIDEIPPFFKNFSQLTSLSLIGDHLTQLSENIRQLQKLKHLDISNNLLKSLPEWLAELTSLEHLNLNMNRLGTIPDSIGQMESLKYINLASNRLESIPYTFVNLQNLEFFAISGNQLESMPLILWEKLKDPTAHKGNNWKFPPYDVRRHNLEFVINYLRNYTPEVFLHNVENKMVSGLHLTSEEIYYPEILKLTGQLEALCARYPNSPAALEIINILNKIGAVKQCNTDREDLRILL